MDYEGLHVELHLNGTATTACINVTILEDEILEGPESFFVVLSTTDPAVNIMERNTEVVILDNDSELLSQECFKYYIYMYYYIIYYIIIIYYVFLDLGIITDVDTCINSHSDPRALCSSHNGHDLCFMVKRPMMLSMSICY